MEESQSGRDGRKGSSEEMKMLPWGLRKASWSWSGCPKWGGIWTGREKSRESSLEVGRQGVAEVLLQESCLPRLRVPSWKKVGRAS